MKQKENTKIDSYCYNGPKKTKKKSIKNNEQKK